MGSLARTSRHLGQCASRLCTLLLDTVWLLRLCLRPRAALAAENLFLRTPLALYQAYTATPRRPTNATRFSLVLLAPWFDGRPALAVVHPETFTRWPRQGVCLFWRGTSCPGRPAIPVELPGLIRQMAHETSPGASGALPTNSYASLACACRRAPSARTCPRMAIARQAAACRHSAGAQACASTRGTFSSVVWLWTSPEVSRRGLHAACGACSVGGAKPSRAGGRSALREPPFP